MPFPTPEITPAGGQRSPFVGPKGEKIPPETSTYFILALSERTCTPLAFCQGEREKVVMFVDLLTFWMRLEITFHADFQPTPPDSGMLMFLRSMELE